MLVRLQDKGTIINIDTNGDKEMFENFCISLPKGEYSNMRMIINSGSSEQLRYEPKSEKIPMLLPKLFANNKPVREYLFGTYIVDENGSDIKIDILPDMNIDLIFF